MRIVAWDLECTDLSAMHGRLLCGSFLPIIAGHESEPYTFRGDARKFRQKDIIDDSLLAVAIRNELEKYNMIVGWNSKLFDAPFLNARLSKGGHRPLHMNLHLDAMWYAGGNSNRIGSKKLVNVQKFYSLGEEKTPIAWEQWQRAAAFDKTAMGEVVHHCEQDVRVLAEAYWRLLPSVANIHR